MNIPASASGNAAPVEPGVNRLGRGFTAVVALILALFSLYGAYFGVFSDMIQRPAHLGLVLMLAYGSACFATGGSIHPAARALAIVGMATAIVVMGYHVLYHREVADRFGELTGLEFYLGIAAIIVLLDATRRSIGWAIVVLAVIFLVYAHFGNLLPGMAGHRGYSVERIVSQLYLGGGGIFGTPLGVSATFVILIVLFGAVLEHSGASKTLMDIATGLTGRLRGGPAKAAVVGSSLMGMISGTAVANVLTTGTISIPLMRRNGYPARSAGAVEAVASTGGQLMPPVMGAAAFLMSDMTSIPYFDIAAAALLPAIIYYVVLFTVVHLEALKQNIPVLDQDDLPSAGCALRTGGYLLLSMVVFVWLLFDGYSVMYASFWAIVATLVLSLVKRSTWLTPGKLLAAAVSAGQAIVPVATACAAAGIIIGVITMTGLGLKFSSLVVTLSGGNLMVALVLTMVASLVLGMGLPTAAAYILVATLVAPALVELGVNLLAAHLFVFYAAMLSSITPPVALAAYAAAGIAGGNPFGIATRACRFGIAAFIVPYMFAYNPALIGQNASWLTIGIAALTAIIGGVSLACAVQGWARGALGLLERAGFLAVAGLMIFAGWQTDIIGVVLLSILVFLQWRRQPVAAGQTSMM